MIAGYVVVAIRDEVSAKGVLALGVHALGAVFDTRAAAEHNCRWLNDDAGPSGRAVYGMSVRDRAEVMELHSIADPS